MKVCEERDKKKRGGGGASAVQGWDSSEGAAVVDLTTSSAANDQMYKLQKGPGDRDIRVSSLRGIKTTNSKKKLCIYILPRTRRR